MKKILILIVVFVSGIFMPVFADTLNYRIIQNGSDMVIIPSQPVIRHKPLFELNSQPAKIPYYSSEKTLPKAKNKARSV